MAATVRRYEASESEWERVKEYLPPERTGERGRPSGDNRNALNGILWMARSGAAWRDLPERYGSWSTLYDKFARWSDAGIIENIFDVLTIDADMQDLSLDSASAKVHQHAAGAKKGALGSETNQDIGVSRGGKNTKIHALVDGIGNPVKLFFTGGNVHDSAVAIDILSSVEISGSVVMGDKAYGSKEIRDYITEHGATYAIPPKANNPDPWDCDWWQYKERHLVECFFNKLKHFRRIATRYDKLISRFKTFTFLAAVMILLK